MLIRDINPSPSLFLSIFAHSKIHFSSLVVTGGGEVGLELAIKEYRTNCMCTFFLFLYSPLHAC